jgi:hypothetical protein
MRTGEVAHMGNEHDDDMDAQVEDSAEGETQKFAEVAEDVEERDAEAAEVERMRGIQENLHEAEGDDVEEG